MATELLAVPQNVGTASLWEYGAAGRLLPPAAARGFHELAYVGDSGTVEVQVGCHVNFWLDVIRATTLQNPSGEFRSGDIINIVFLRAGPEVYGDKYLFHGGFAPQFEEGVGVVNFLCAIYFAPQDKWLCSWLAGMAPPGA